MKIYILTGNPFPVGMAATNRIICYAKGLIAHGEDCEVIVFNRTERQDKQQRNFIAGGVYGNIPYRYIGKSVLRSRLFFQRRLDDVFDYFRTLCFAFSLKRNDVLLNFHPRIGLFVPLFLISRIKHFKMVRELCEYPRATVKDSLKYRLLRWFELHMLFRFFSGFVVISHSLEKVAFKYKGKHSKVVRIPILVDIHGESHLCHSHPHPYILHSGTMYERKDAIVSTMKAFAMAVRRLNYSVDFILAGPKSPHWDELQEIIKENNMGKNVIFLGQLSKDEVAKYQNGASLSILNKNDNLQNRYGFSTKLGEILLSDTAVITTSVGEACYYLKNDESAYVVEPHKIELIAEKIVDAFSNNEKRIRIASNGRQVALANFDCDIQAKRLKEFFALL